MLPWSFHPGEVGLPGGCGSPGEGLAGPVRVSSVTGHVAAPTPEALSTVGTDTLDVPGDSTSRARWDFLNTPPPPWAWANVLVPSPVHLPLSTLPPTLPPCPPTPFLPQLQPDLEFRGPYSWVRRSPALCRVT